MGKRVLLIEDNVKLNEINRRALESQGYSVTTALTLAAAREHLARFAPDVILLDVVLPDGSGYDFCREIRRSTDAHILFLTPRREHEEKLRGISLGGDDYITKPFRLDVLASQALVEGFDLLLTPKEFALLYMFAQHENITMRPERLYEEVWKQPLMQDKRSLQKHISELRCKLAERNCEYTITAVYSKGYRFEKNPHEY